MATSLYAAPIGIPVFRWFDANGNPLAGGKVECYVAGTSTPLDSYPTYVDALAGTNPNANPVILDANGAAQIWLQATLYKIIVKDSAGVLQYSQDNVSSALGFPSPAVTEWVRDSRSITFLTATTFQVNGVDATAEYSVGRRIRSTNTGVTIYSTVTASAFAANTLVTVVNDSGSLDATMSNLSYGLLTSVNRSYLDPATLFSAIKNGNQTGFAATTKLTGWTVQTDVLGEWDAANNRWVAKYPGKYRVTFSAEHSNTVASINAVAEIRNGVSLLAQATGRAYSVATNVTSLCAHYDAVLGTGGRIECNFLGDANTTVVGSVGTRLSIERVQ